MRLLLPADDERAVPAEVTDEDLLDLYRWPDGRWTRANMVAALDGRVAGADGKSGSLSDDADRRVFQILRRTCDAIVVGAGTVLSEGYGPVRTDERWSAWRLARGMADRATLVIVSGGAHLPPAAAAATNGPNPTLVVVGPTAPADRVAALRSVAEVIVAPSSSSTGAPSTEELPTAAPAAGGAVASTGGVPGDWLLDELAGRGLPRVLVEGGPTLLGALTGQLDDLCLTTVGALGGSPDAAPLVPGRVGEVPRRARLAHLLAAGDTLLARWEFTGSAVLPPLRSNRPIVAQ